MKTWTKKEEIIAAEILKTSINPIKSFAGQISIDHTLLFNMFDHNSLHSVFLFLS